MSMVKANWRPLDYFESGYIFVITPEKILRASASIDAVIVQNGGLGKKMNEQDVAKLLYKADAQLNPNFSKIKNYTKYPETTRKFDKFWFLDRFTDLGCIEIMSGVKTGGATKQTPFQIPYQVFGEFIHEGVFTPDICTHHDIHDIGFVLELYDELAKRKAITQNPHEVFIVSSDGLLERKSQSLRAAISKFLQAGNRLTYFTPTGSKGDKVVEDWRAVCSDLINLDVNHKLPEIRGLPENWLLTSSRETRRQVFVLENGSSENVRMFTYMRTDAGEDGSLVFGINRNSENVREFWIESTRVKSIIEHGKLTKKTVYKLSRPSRLDPSSPNYTRPSNVAQLQDGYRRMFQLGPEMNPAYVNAIRKIQTSSVNGIDPIKMCAKYVAEARGKISGPPNPLLVLDIGAGSGVPTVEFLNNLETELEAQSDGKDSLNPDFRQPFLCTAIDTVSVFDFETPEARSDIFCRQIAFEKFQTNQKFDIITFFHATYMLDHEMLLKAIGLLKPGGTLAILTSPVETNLLNMITVELDCVLEERKIITRNSACSTRDPFRNYGEDTLSFLEDCFPSELGVSSAVLKQHKILDKIPARLVLSDNGLLTDTFWDLFKMFGWKQLNRLSKQGECMDSLREMVSANFVDTSLWPRPDEDTFSNDNWVLTIQIPS